MNLRIVDTNSCATCHFEISDRDNPCIDGNGENVARFCAYHDEQIDPISVGVHFIHEVVCKHFKER